MANTTTSHRVRLNIKRDVLTQFQTGLAGDVIWVDRKNATADHLAYVNDAGNAVIKVDNTTFVPYNIKRNSVSTLLDLQRSKYV
jgi:hypothetical protein